MAPTTRTLIAGGADQLTALPLSLLSPTFHRDTVSPGSTQAARNLAGCLWIGAAVLMDDLFEGLSDMARRPHGPGMPTAEDTFLGEALPPAHLDEYTDGFVHQFVVTTADLIARFNTTWSRPSCPAQDLALCLILDQVQIQRELSDVALEPGWREHLERTLFGSRTFVDVHHGRTASPLPADRWFASYPGHTVSPFLIRTF